MKAFKYAIVSAILALGIAAPVASAQDDTAPAPTPAPAKPGKGGGGGGAGRNFNMITPMLKGIDLTAAQQTKVDAIKADIQKQMGAAAGDRAKMRQIRQTAEKQLRDVLTADQQKTFDENLKALPAQGRGKGGGQGGNQDNIQGSGKGGGQDGSQGSGKGRSKKGGATPASDAGSEAKTDAGE